MILTLSLVVSGFLIGRTTQSTDAYDLLTRFVERTAVETQRRRPDLVPYRSRERKVAPGEHADLYDAVYRSWFANRPKEALAPLERAAAVAGSADRRTIDWLGQLLARSGRWAEARDLLGVNLTMGEPLPIPTALYFVAVIESGATYADLRDSGFEAAVRLWTSSRWEIPPSEMARVYPSDREALRRLVWATYATSSLNADDVEPNNMIVEGTVEEINAPSSEPSEGGARTYPAGLHETAWAMSEAYRLAPGDPIAAYLASFEGRLHLDTPIDPPPGREARRKQRSDRARAFLLPVMRRLHPDDVLYARLYGRLIGIKADVTDLAKPLRSISIGNGPGQ